MFTGIVQGVASVQSITDRPGLRTFTLSFANGFTDGLSPGASVSVAGVCLTVTGRPQASAATFDVMQQTMSLTTLGALKERSQVNVERSAHVGAEIGGHPLSGHVDFTATVHSVRKPQNNRVLRLAVPARWTRYLFDKGFIAVNGASLTIADVHRDASGAGWFEVWLIPETLRATTFSELKKNDLVNVEVDRQTQILVDGVRTLVDERIDAVLGELRHSMAQRVAASMARAMPKRLRGASQPDGGHVTMATKKKAKKTKLKPRGDDPTGPHAMKPRGDDPTGPHAKRPKKKK